MLCEKCGSHANIQFQTYCPPVLNNPDLYQLFNSAAKELLGPENVKKLSTHSMGSEDFGCYTEKIPGLLIRLGMGTQSPTLHTSEFDFSDDALETGITILSGLALRAGQPDCHIRNNA